MRVVIALIGCALTVFNCSATASAVQSDAVLTELAQRSQLPRPDLQTLLADCNLNQQSMHFCAWRDQIAAQQTFDAALRRKKKLLPSCSVRLQSSVEKWQRSREKICDAAAQQDAGGGSAQSTAKALCITAQTSRMTTHLRRLHGCNF